MSKPTSRDDTLASLLETAPEVVATGFAFHLEVANHLGLSLADLRYLRQIAALAPATVSEIATDTGLTSGATTRMIDRLEQAGFVHRQRDQHDRRSVRVVTDDAAAARIAALYQGLATGWTALLTPYSDSELRLILDLFNGMRALSLQQLAALRTDSDRAGTRS